MNFILYIERWVPVSHSISSASLLTKREQVIFNSAPCSRFAQMGSKRVSHPLNDQLWGYLYYKDFNNEDSSALLQVYVYYGLFFLAALRYWNLNCFLPHLYIEILIVLALGITPLETF